MAADPDGEVDLARIRQECSHGLDELPPEERALSWLILAKVMPLQSQRWADLRERRKREYLSFVEEFSMSSYECKTTPNSSPDFPVSNAELMNMIHGDVIRTSHHLAFLVGADEGSFSPDDPLHPYRHHIWRIERILYVFASLNPTISYMQGFNELCTVIYYVMSRGPPWPDADEREVESLTFFLFHQLFAVTKLHELFMTQDGSSMIHRRLNAFMRILETHYPEIAHVITNHGIHPIFFGFKWLNLLFAQDYMIPDLVLIWDALFSHFEEMIEYATYVAVAQVKCVEDGISANSFRDTISALQKTTGFDVKKVMELAREAWEKDHAPGG